ncbi:MAG: MTH938/NDUFAF3 family protein [Methanolobus sp.]|nr:MTH938/NDUFAF3 family protein [Methanolobus sp.]
MNPKIDSTEFGSITIEGKLYEKDVLVRLNGNVKKRKKKLSKVIYGTSHIISLDEAKYVYEKGAEKLIIGSGQDGMVKLSDEARDFFKDKDCKVKLFPTQEAIGEWNLAEGKVIGLFHVTC